MNDYVIITAIDKIDKTKWSEFVFDHPHGNIFQTPEMYEVYQNTKNYEPVFLAVVNDKGEISGTLLAVIQKEYSGILGNFTARSIVHGGPLIKNDDPDVLGFVLKEYNMIIKKKAIYSQFRNFWDVLPENDVFQKYGFRFEDHLNYIIDLAVGEEVRWSLIHKSRKKKIKKAHKNDLYIETYYSNIANKQIENGYKIISDVYRSKGLPIASIEYFIAAAKKNILALFVVKKDNVNIACRFALIYKDVIFGWYAGSYKSYYKLFPNDLLIWETLKWGIRNNYRYFDYGGAGEPNKPYGVRNFKAQMGGQLVNYGRYEKIHKPFLYNLAKIGFKFWRSNKKK